MALNQALDGSVFNGEGDMVPNDDDTICESEHFTIDLKYKGETCMTSFWFILHVAKTSVESSSRLRGQILRRLPTLVCEPESA